MCDAWKATDLCHCFGIVLDEKDCELCKAATNTHEALPWLIQQHTVPLAAAAERLQLQIEVERLLTERGCFSPSLALQVLGSGPTLTGDRHEREQQRPLGGVVGPQVTTGPLATSAATENADRRAWTRLVELERALFKVANDLAELWTQNKRGGGSGPSPSVAKGSKRRSPGNTLPAGPPPQRLKVFASSSSPSEKSAAAVTAIKDTQSPLQAKAKQLLQREKELIAQKERLDEQARQLEALKAEVDADAQRCKRAAAQVLAREDNVRLAEEKLRRVEEELLTWSKQ